MTHPLMLCCCCGPRSSPVGKRTRRGSLGAASLGDDDDSDDVETSSASSASDTSGSDSDGDGVDMFKGSAKSGRVSRKLKRRASAKASAEKKEAIRCVGTFPVWSAPRRCVWVTCASWFLVVSGRLERIRAFRRQLRIKVSGAAISDPIHTFPEMKVATRRAKGILLHNIEESGTAQPIATTCFV